MVFTSKMFLTGFPCKKVIHSRLSAISCAQSSMQWLYSPKQDRPHRACSLGHTTARSVSAEMHPRYTSQLGDATLSLLAMEGALATMEGAALSGTESRFLSSLIPQGSSAPVQQQAIDIFQKYLGFWIAPRVRPRGKEKQIPAGDTLEVTGTVQDNPSTGHHS